jgi:hypothetical protein
LARASDSQAPELIGAVLSLANWQPGVTVEIDMGRPLFAFASLPLGPHAYRQ